MRNAGYRADMERQSILYQIADDIDCNDGVMRELTSMGYAMKEEFHITIVPRESGERLSPRQFGRIVVGLETLPLLDYQIGHELFQISKPKSTKEGSFERQALVAPVMTSNVSSLLFRLRDIADGDAQLPVPFTHLTIATKPDTDIAARGIGIATAKEWSDLQPELFSKNWRSFE